MGNNQICGWKRLQRSFSLLLDTFHDRELISRLFDCWTASFVRKRFCLEQNLCSHNLGLNVLMPSSPTVNQAILFSFSITPIPQNLERES